LRATTIGASYGDAFLAALAVGDVKREAINDWNPKASEVTRNAANAGVFKRTYEIIRELYPRTRDLMARTGLSLTAPNLWLRAHRERTRNPESR
jgi:xylulokinase